MQRSMVLLVFMVCVAAFHVGAQNAQAPSPAAPSSPPVVFRGGIWQWPTAAEDECEYHPTPADGRAMTLKISPTSHNLKADKLGSYWEGNDTVRSYFGKGGVAYNFFTYWPETCTKPLPRQVRALLFDLTAPRGGARSRGVVHAQLAGMHVFPPQKGAVTAIKDIGVGMTIPAQRVLLRFQDGTQLGTTIYYLRMGTEPFEGQGLGGHVEQLSGEGTTTAQIRRESDKKWVISAKPGSLARLSIWGPQPKDLGLYEFSFEMTIEVQRPN